MSSLKKDGIHDSHSWMEFYFFVAKTTFETFITVFVYNDVNF
jgi:hypothetical protein